MKLYTQHDTTDCGPSCLRMISEHYGRKYSLQELRKRSFIDREGVSLLGLSDAAESIGFRSIGVKMTYDKLLRESPLPCILHWNDNHFVVLHKIKNKKFSIADPIGQKVVFSESEFRRAWLHMEDDGSSKGVALLLEPTPEFYEKDGEQHSLRKYSFNYLFSYLKKYRKFVIQLLLGLVVVSLIQLIFPFLSQSIVDVGINTRDLNFVYLILVGQLMLFIGRTSVDFIRQWILLHLSTRINVSLVSDFLIKLMKLPLSFFDSKKVGDLLQRIGDHSRIQTFISSSTLNILFSIFNLIIFGSVILFYSVKIFLIFFIGSSVYFVYVILFLNKRKSLDYKKFEQRSANQSTLIELLNGMTEIKLNGAEKTKRWEWERVQARLFKTNVESTRLIQFQESGSLFINELKNILITFTSATAVIHGSMTLGMMLAVQYIIGQLNAPVSQAINFILRLQDAKISLERIGEVHSLDDEESEDKDHFIPLSGDVIIKNLSFSYNGPGSANVIDNFSLEIPKGSITAIVGSSGSGKTTLMKLLLKIHDPTSGDIYLGKTPLKHTSSKRWRAKCGVVMQDGYIFSDTIAKNISLDDEFPDKGKLIHACEMANIHSFIESLPHGYKSKIGKEGIGLSHGQQQRLLIARAVYKDPEYLFFDEATSSLDTNTEKVIMENLNKFFAGRTVVVIAHRLSTVKNASQIVVLEKGEIKEQGDHLSLTALKGSYYELVRNQLELG